MGPNSSDLAQNLPPGVFFHEDSESGLRMGGFRGKNPDFDQKLALALAKMGDLIPPHLGVDRGWGYFEPKILVACDPIKIFHWEGGSRPPQGAAGTTGPDKTFLSETCHGSQSMGCMKAYNDTLNP